MAAGPATSQSLFDTMSSPDSAAFSRNGTGKLGAKRAPGNKLPRTCGLSRPPRRRAAMLVLFAQGETEAQPQPPPASLHQGRASCAQRPGSSARRGLGRASGLLTARPSSHNVAPCSGRSLLGPPRVPAAATPPRRACSPSGCSLRSASCWREPSSCGPRPPPSAGSPPPPAWPSPPGGGERVRGAWPSPPGGVAG